MTDDIVIFEGVAFTDDAELEIDEDTGQVTNHEELVENGETHLERRALSADGVDPVPDHMIIEPGGEKWLDKYDDWEVGDSEVLIE